MTSRCALALLLLLAPLARADDQEAARLLREARAHWEDPSPDEAVRLAEEALALPTTPFMKANALLMLGSLHQVKTGKLDDALARFDEVVSVLKDDGSQESRRLRAQALVRKANIIYAERDDHAGALELYRQAQEAQQLASTADT